MHVVGAGVRIDRSNGDPYIDFYTSGSANNVALYGGSSTGFRAFVGGTERLRITSGGQLSHIGGGSTGSPAVGFNGSAPSNSLVVDSTGRVGIGTSSPSQLLTTVGNIKIAGAQAGNVAKLCLTRTDRSWTINNETDLRFRTSTGDTDSPATATVVFASNGNVGIGTTSPAELLELAATTDPKIQFTDVGNVISKIGISASTALTFEHNGSERARIDSSGTFRVKGAGTAGVNDAVQLNGSAPANSLLLDASGRLLVGTSTSAGNAKFEVVETRRLSATPNGSGWLELTDSAAVTSGVLTDIATVSMTSPNTCYFRLEVNAGHDDSNGGYSGVVSIREGIISQYASTPRVLNNAETQNLAGSVNAGVIAIAVTTDVVTGTSGVTSTLVFRATVAVSGSAAGTTTPRVSYRLSLLSNVDNTVTAASNI